MLNEGSALPAEDSVCIHMLGRFELADRGRAIDLPADAQRLVAFLALQDRRLPRDYVAGTLWIEKSQDRAYGNLRSALWRLRNRSAGLVDANQLTLAITATTQIDVDIATAKADRLCAADDACKDLEYELDLFTQELLPGWYDDWAIVERERLRQQSLHALEAIAGRLSSRGRHLTAIQAALAAIRLDPLRESAHRCLIRIHVSEGNYSEAYRHYENFARLLYAELGLEPSPKIRRLVRQLVP